MLDVVKFRLTLEVEKLVVGGFSVPGYNVSTSRLWDYFIPASSLKGRIRQVLELSYGNDEILKEFFDNALILFSDLIGERTREVEIVQARINRLSSKAEDPRSILAVSGRFSGELRIIVDESVPKEHYFVMLERLRRALESLKFYGLGRFSNVGYGRVIDRKLSDCESVLRRCDCDFECSQRPRGSQGGGDGYRLHTFEPKSAVLFYSYLPTSSTLYRAACRLYHNAGIKVPKAIGGPYLRHDGKLYALGGSRLAALEKTVGLQGDPPYYTAEGSNVSIARPIGRRIVPRLIVDRLSLRSTGSGRVAYNRVYVLNKRGWKIAIITDNDEYEEFLKLLSALGIGRYKSIQSGFEYVGSQEITFDGSKVLDGYTFTLNDYPLSHADKVIGRLHEYPYEEKLYLYVHGGLAKDNPQERPEVTRADGKCGISFEKLPLGFPKRSARAPVIIQSAPWRLIISVGTTMVEARTPPSSASASPVSP